MKYNILVFSVLVLLFASCNGLKPVVDNGNKGNNGELDPIIGKDHRETPVVVSTDNNGRVDTIRWRKPLPNEYPPPITTGGSTTTNNNSNTGNNSNPKDPNNNSNTGTSDPVVEEGTKKGTYNISVLMPFFADKVTSSTSKIPQNTIRSLRYYEGILLGLRKLEQEGMSLNVKVFDTKRSTEVVNGLLEKQELLESDLIIGPVASNNVKIVADFGLKNKKAIVSLNSGENLTQNNPYYLQASPSLNTHCETILKYIKQTYPNKSVTLVVRNNASEINRFNYFRNAEQLLSPDYGMTSINEYIVEGNSRSYKTSNLKNYLSRTDTSIIIVPSWNQAFVYSILRDMSILRRNYPMVVFGMPAWIDFDKIEADYYENLNVHISSSSFMNEEDPNIKAFRRSFFDEYGAVPSEEAYKGYDFVIYLGRMLKENGTGFINNIDLNPQEMLHTTIRFEPKFDASASAENNPTPQQYENRYVNILRFIEYHFIKVN